MGTEEVSEDTIDDKSLENAKDIHATRDEEVVAAALVASKTMEEQEEDSESEGDDEIDSARAELRESALEDDDDGEDDEGEDDSEDLAFYQRIIEQANGTPAARVENLKTHLSGTIVLSIADEKQGYKFSWKKDCLEVNRWSESRPKKADCVIEISKKHLEEILRGKLNPQVAMLSHKVRVEGDTAHAVYFFNLFPKQRR